jgi:hypothetical protein
MKTFVTVLLVILLGYFCLPDIGQREGINEFAMGPAEPVPDQNNLFNAIVGFTIEPGKSPVSEGARLVRMANMALDEYLKSGKQAGKNTKPAFDPHWENPALTVSDDINLLCDPRMKSCLDIWLAQQETIENSLIDNAVLMSRYLKMLQFTAYHNDLTPDIRAPIPELSSFIAINRLYGIMYALLYLSGGHEAAITALNRDIAFIRRLLQQADTMLLKMVALSMLKHDLYIYETIMDVPVTNNYFSKNIPLLSAEERSFLKPVKFEFNINRRLVIEMREYPQIYFHEFYYPDWFPFPLFKKNHSINMLYNTFDNILRESRLPAKEFYQLALDKPDRKQRLKPNWLSYIYNPVGSILFSVSFPDFDKYIIRIHDMNGLITLINLKQMIKRNKITENNINVYLEENRDNYSNPYTGKSIHWNSLEQTLWTESPLSGYASTRIHLKFEPQLENRQHLPPE